jgi:hypothetical protein
MIRLTLNRHLHAAKHRYKGLNQRKIFTQSGKASHDLVCVESVCDFLSSRATSLQTTQIINNNGPTLGRFMHRLQIMP